MAKKEDSYYKQTMFYYDFSTELSVKDWIMEEAPEGRFSRKSTFECEEGNYTVLSTVPYAHLADKCILEKIYIDGKELGKIYSTAFIRTGGARGGRKVFLEKGSHEIRITGVCTTHEIYDQLDISIIPAEKKAPDCPVFHLDYDFPVKEYTSRKCSFDTEGFIAGLGKEPTPGRFGFSKGDGLLDFGMPTLGNMDKMYLCGHKKYRKPYRWSYSTMPENALQHGSYPPAETGIGKDKVTVNHLSVKWDAILAGEEFSCTYSLGTAGVITERPSGKMRISGLEFAGNYQYVLFPGEGEKIKILPLKELPSHIKELGANYILLFGSTEFPDLPLLVVFQKKPENASVKYSSINGRLNEISFENCPLVITATPYGIQSFDPINPLDKAFVRDMTEKCRFWSRAFLAYPVKCVEYYFNDKKAKRTFFRQKFSYRYIKDDWGTVPLETAVLPPVADLSGLMQTPEDQKTMDFHFPTKFGLLKGVLGDVSAYSLPFMERARKFPFREKGSPLPELLKDGLKEYIDFVKDLDDNVIYYPYAGSLIEPYAFATTLLNFMDEESRKILRKKVAERLLLACSDGKCFDYPAIIHGNMMKIMPDDEKLKEIYADPSLKHLKMYCWYKRTEPFTNAQFDICYINLCFLSSGLLEGRPEEVASFKFPMIENDWGVGLTFYYMYLCALATGRWNILREKLPLLKRAMRYFVNMNDFACLGSGYSDNCMLWVEGANYGAFTSYVNIAEGCGDKETFEEALYLASRQFALRCAITRSSAHYLHHYYDEEPYFTGRALHEEGYPSWQFQRVPRGTPDKSYDSLAIGALFHNRLRRDGIYNMTTEGLFPEFFEGGRKYLPEDSQDIFFRMFCIDDPQVTVPWNVMQQTTSLLIDMALDDGRSPESVKNMIERARKEDRLMQKWRGIHIPSRRLPTNYLETQLLAWTAMKSHPAWLEHWVDLTIENMLYDEESKTAEITLLLCDKTPVLRLGVRTKDFEAYFNGEKVQGVFTEENKWEYIPASSGVLVLKFH